MRPGAGTEPRVQAGSPTDLNWAVLFSSLAWQLRGPAPLARTQPWALAGDAGGSCVPLSPTHRQGKPGARGQGGTPSPGWCQVRNAPRPGLGSRKQWPQLAVVALRQPRRRDSGPCEGLHTHGSTRVWLPAHPLPESQPQLRGSSAAGGELVAGWVGERRSSGVAPIVVGAVGLPALGALKTEQLPEQRPHPATRQTLGDPWEALSRCFRGWWGRAEWVGPRAMSQFVPASSPYISEPQCSCVRS